MTRHHNLLSTASAFGAISRGGLWAAHGAVGGEGVPITFGVSSAPDTAISGAANEEHLYRITLAQAMQVTGLSVDLSNTPAARAGSFRLTLRANGASAPGALLAVTATATEAGVASGAVVDLDVVTPATIQPGDYWLGIHMGGEAVETAAKTTGGLQRGKLADTFADGTSTAPGTFTNFGGTIALLVWARGVTV